MKAKHKWYTKIYVGNIGRLQCACIRLIRDREANTNCIERYNVIREVQKGRQQGNKEKNIRIKRKFWLRWWST